MSSVFMRKSENKLAKREKKSRKTQTAPGINRVGFGRWGEREIEEGERGYNERERVKEAKKRKLHGAT